MFLREHQSHQRKLNPPQRESTSPKKAQSDLVVSAREWQRCHAARRQEKGLLLILRVAICGDGKSDKYVKKS